MPVEHFVKIPQPVWEKFRAAVVEEKERRGRSALWLALDLLAKRRGQRGREHDGITAIVFELVRFALREDAIGSDRALKDFRKE